MYRTNNERLGLLIKFSTEFISLGKCAGILLDIVCNFQNNIHVQMWRPLNLKYQDMTQLLRVQSAIACLGMTDEYIVRVTLSGPLIRAN